MCQSAGDYVPKAILDSIKVKDLEEIEELSRKKELIFLQKEKN